MMKKNMLCILTCILLVMMSAGCGSDGTSGRTTNGQTGVEDVLQAGIADADSLSDADESETETDISQTDVQDGETRQNGLNENAPEPENNTSENASLSNTDGIDVDLTSLSSTMVYSEVYSMMYDPDSYIGKTVKMNGLFTVYHDESTGNNYFACIIQDATACCSQGMEFVLTDDYAYPSDYPEVGSEITVTGVFDT